jgi:hypothetical protein
MQIVRRLLLPFINDLPKRGYGILGHLVRRLVRSVVNGASEKTAADLALGHDFTDLLSRLICIDSFDSHGAFASPAPQAARIDPTITSAAKFTRFVQIPLRLLPTLIA